MTIDDLRRFLREYFEGYKVEVYLFGSRAKGTHVEGSDIDIAILSEEDVSDRIALLRAILEESNFPYRVDIVDLSRAPLSEGEGDGGGNKVALNKQMEDFKRALTGLRESYRLAEENRGSRCYEFLRDGAIQRFEFTVEIMWKSMKSYLEEVAEETFGRLGSFMEH